MQLTALPRSSNGIPGVIAWDGKEQTGKKIGKGMEIRQCKISINICQTFSKTGLLAVSNTEDYLALHCKLYTR